MISVDGWLQKEKPDARLVMQVHDELIFEIPQEQVESASENIRRLMDNVAKLRVPLLVDVGVGRNWDEAH